MTKTTTRFLIAIAITAGTCRAQNPDKRGEVAHDRPEYKGVKANAPIPSELHIENEGGSDGAGLCVISAAIIDGRYQRVPGLEKGKDSRLWRAAKQAPGGYYPEKLAKLVDAAMPGEKYASYEGTDTAVLEQLSARGYPIAATMNTGRLYHYQPIHHMISLIHYKRKQWACVVDNNEPGVFRWMPADEYDRRWIDGGEGWAWIWTRLPPFGSAHSLTATVMIAAAALVVTVARRTRRHAQAETAQAEAQFDDDDRDE